MVESGVRCFTPKAESIVIDAPISTG